MLKKSLHFFIRCLFLLLIICSLLFLCACKKGSKDDYFYFLKKNGSYQIKLFLDEKEAFECKYILSFESGTRKSEMQFISPDSLKESNIRLLFSDDDKSFFFGEEEISNKKIPTLWETADILFHPCASVKEVRKEGGKTFIDGINSDGEVITYKINENSLLEEISSTNIRIEISRGE